MPIIPVIRRLRQEDIEFKASLLYIVKPCLKKLNNFCSISTFCGDYSSRIFVTVLVSEIDS
jgi:hypothetical protein